MFKVPSYLDETDYVQVNLNTPLTFPGNGQAQTNTGHRFTMSNRNNYYDCYNAFFRVDFTFEATGNGALVAVDTRSAPINGSFSLIPKVTVKSSGKNVYEADGANKAIFIKNLLDFSDDFSRSVAKSQFWYLDSDDTKLTTDAETNTGIRQGALLSQGGALKTVKTIIPLNRYSFFEGLSDRLLPPMQLEFEITLHDDTEMIFKNNDTARRIVVRKFELWARQLHFTGKGQMWANENFLRPTQWNYLKETVYQNIDRRGKDGKWLITPGVKNPKHVFVFIQRANKRNAYTQNPFLFDTFDIDSASAKMASCRLRYGSSYYPDTEYENDFKLRILNGLINFRYRKND